jgi:hypothetical protein
MPQNPALAAFTCIFLSLPGAVAQTPATRIVSAANALISTLDQNQRKTLLFAFNDEQQRAR